ncbi:MAG: peptidase M16 [Rhodospirillaceae bacterium]|nr:MAG: peptidase M16 [Rhodospirillaceae bacterium]
MHRVVLAFVFLCLTALPARAVVVERVTSPKGVEAWLIQDLTTPLIAVNLLFRGGAALDPPGQVGLAALASALLDEGAGELNHLAFQTRLEDLGIRFGFTADHDAITGFLQTLTENRETAFEMLKLALMAPRFDADAVERVRTHLLTILKQMDEDPDTVAGQAWFAHVFPDHPYGRPVAGTPEGLGAITVTDLKAFVAARFGRDNLLVSVAGDITSAQLAPLLDKAFGDLPAQSQPFTVPEVTPKATDRIIVARKKDIPQSVAVFGHGGISVTDPDWYTATLINHILGGNDFNARLMKEVRKRRGLAYSVSSTLLPFSYERTALIMGSVATQNDRFRDSLTIIQNEWRRMAEQGPTETELVDAKTYLTRVWPLALDRTDRMAHVLLVMQEYNLGLDYLDKRNDYVERITLADARRVAARLLQPDALMTIVVGQPTMAESGQPDESK